MTELRTKLVKKMLIFYQDKIIVIINIIKNNKVIKIKVIEGQSPGKPNWRKFP